MELLTRLESTSEQEIGLVIYEEVHTAKNYIAFVGKTSSECYGILYVEAANDRS
jgi:hypothetical protein